SHILFSFSLSLPFSFQSSPPPRNLHSFPTRRSSDLLNLASALGAFGAAYFWYRSATLRVLYDPAKDDGSAGILIEDSGKRYDFLDRKSTRLNSSHVKISYAVFCLKKKKKKYKHKRHI